jgi:hypothetical protein
MFETHIQCDVYADDADSYFMHRKETKMRRQLLEFKQVISAIRYCRQTSWFVVDSRCSRLSIVRSLDPVILKKKISPIKSSCQ